jgi:nucleoside 2-deoxyribosyltransferase
MKIYLAGPFFNDKERKVIERVRDYLRNQGHEVIVPMELVIPGGTNLPNYVWADRVFEADVKEITACNLVVAVYHGHYSDSGTAWEIGYAYGIGTPVVLVHTNKKNVASIMLASSCMINVSLEDLEKLDLGHIMLSLRTRRGVNSFMVEQK